MQSMDFSSPEYWSGYPFPSLGDLPNSGIEPKSPALQANSLPSELPGKPNIYPIRVILELLCFEWILKSIAYCIDIIFTKIKENNTY